MYGVENRFKIKLLLGLKGSPLVGVGILNFVPPDATTAGRSLPAAGTTAGSPSTTIGAEKLLRKLLDRLPRGGFRLTDLGVIHDENVICKIP